MGYSASAPYEKFTSQANAALERKAQRYADNFDFAAHGIKVEIMLADKAPAKVFEKASKLSGRNGCVVGRASADAMELARLQQYYSELQRKNGWKATPSREMLKVGADIDKLRVALQAAEAKQQAASEVVATAASEPQKVELAKPKAKRPRKAKAVDAPTIAVAAIAPAPVVDVAPAPVVDVAPAPVVDVAPAPVVDVAPAPARRADRYFVGFRRLVQAIAVAGKLSPMQARAVAEYYINRRLATIDASTGNVRLSKSLLTAAALQKVLAATTASTSERFASYCGNVAKRVVGLLVKLATAWAKRRVEAGIAKLSAKVAQLSR